MSHVSRLLTFILLINFEDSFFAAANSVDTTAAKVAVLVVLQELEEDGLQATAITLSLAGNLVFKSNLKSGHPAVFSDALSTPDAWKGRSR